MNKYRLVAKKGEGTFSEVLKAQAIKNGKYVAIKCMKNHFDSLDQVNNLREIQALRRLSPHPHIIKLLEVLYDQPTGRLALVFELMDMNIYELIRGRRHYLSEDRVRSYMYQLMKALDHMHRNGIFHRDIKPENILIMDDVLKLADFGSCRGIYSKQPYTEYISTRWYRAPECLLTDGYYNYKMDMWGVGCVMFEIVALYPLFPGNNELDQIQKIHAITGTPPPELLAKLKKRSTHSSCFDFPPTEGSGLAKLLSHVPPDCADLIAKLLAYNPDERLSARQALRHPYFRERREADKRAKAAMQPDLLGSSHLAAMDSEYGSQQQQHPAAAAAAGIRRTESGDLSDPAVHRAGLDAQEGSAGPSSVRQDAGAAANAAAAAGVAGVLTEHLAAVAAAAAAAVAAAAVAGGKDPGGGAGAGGSHSMLPAISNSGAKTLQHSQHSMQGQQHQQQQQQHAGGLPAQPPGQQQHRQRQPGLQALHTTSHQHQHHQHQHHQHQHHQQQPQHQQLQQHSIQHGQHGQHRQQQQLHGSHTGLGLEGLQGHQLLASMGSSSLKDRDGSILQLLAEASSMSVQAGPHVQGLGLQASMGSLWQEASGVGQAGGSGSGQMLPPLVGKGGAGSSGVVQHSARRRSQLGHVKQQQQQQAHTGVGAAAAAASSNRNTVSGIKAHLASKAGLLQEQQHQHQQQLLHGRSSHHGMQVSSARYHRQSNTLQPAGSLASSSMTNLSSSLQLGAGTKHGRAAAGMALSSSQGGGGKGAVDVGGGAAAAAAAATGGRAAPGSQYVSPYGQQRR